MIISELMHINNFWEQPLHFWASNLASFCLCLDTYQTLDSCIFVGTLGNIQATFETLPLMPVSTASLFFTLLNMLTSLHSFWLITSMGFNSPTEHLHIFCEFFFCFVLIKTFFSARLGHQFVGRRGHVKGVRHMGGSCCQLELWSSKLQECHLHPWFTSELQFWCTKPNAT